VKYRKKPVVIDAIRWNGSHFEEGKPPEWLIQAIDKTPGETGSVFRGLSDDNADKLYVWTLEGLMEAKPGDWIIRGVKGELYACKPDIFAATYEPWSSSFYDPETDDPRNATLGRVAA
jgi:hypothetical protein